MLFIAVLSLVFSVATTLADQTQGRRHLPKSRSEMLHEAEERARLHHLAKLEREKQQEENQALAQAAAERRKQWTEERRRKLEAHQEFLRKQAKEEAEKEAAELLLLQKQKELEKQQQEEEQHQKELEAAADDAKQQQQHKISYNGDREGAIPGGRIDCFGVPGGSARVDACGVCGGDDSSCSDCAGVPNGNATEDCAGVCGGTDMSCVDCAGVMNGISQLDECGVCNGDGQSCRDCLGVVNGLAQLDVCGVCEGDGSSCLDCHGVANGPGELDPCGVCDGDGSSCCSPVVRHKDTKQRGDAIDSDSDGDSWMLCSGHGTCSYQHQCCHCDLGWTGPYCSIKQNLCLQVIQGHDSKADDRQLDSRDYCNQRGVCDPETGACRCDDPEAWYGPRCERSWCNHRGRYDLEWGRCICNHGYGGQFCERCAAVHPNSKQSHVCMMISDTWQEVPEELRSERSRLLEEKNPKAPFFRLIDADRNLAIAFENGHSFMNLAPTKRAKHRLGHLKLKRDFIWPNSTHAASGYYYDCGCQLAAPPQAHGGGSGETGEEVTEERYHYYHQNGTLPTGRANRVHFNKLLRRNDRHGYGPGLPTHARQQLQLQMKAKAAQERALHERAPVNLNQCRDLLQQVLDEFGFALDAATAESAELAAAIGDVSSTCGSEASFAFAWWLISLGVAAFLIVVSVGCIWASNRYIRFRGPLEDITG